MEKQLNILWLFSYRKSKQHVQSSAQYVRRKSIHWRRWRQEADCSINSASGASSATAYSGISLSDYPSF